jgi:hypothetical protein
MIQKTAGRAVWLFRNGFRKMPTYFFRTVEVTLMMMDTEEDMNVGYLWWSLTKTANNMSNTKASKVVAFKGNQLSRTSGVDGETLYSSWKELWFLGFNQNINDSSHYSYESTLKHHFVLSTGKAITFIEILIILTFGQFTQI